MTEHPAWTEVARLRREAAIERNRIIKWQAKIRSSEERIEGLEERISAITSTNSAPLR